MIRRLVAEGVRQRQVARDLGIGPETGAAGVGVGTATEVQAGSDQPDVANLIAECN